jgi:hypothetical protein
MPKPTDFPVRSAPEPESASAVRVAYADPPYLGQAKKHYGPSAREVNHELLISHLQAFDGWALSASSVSLRTLLPMCPEGVRVAAWVKPFASFKPNVNPAYAWEPVIFSPARGYPRDELTVRDWLSASITLETGLAGVKPPPFWDWLFRLLGAAAGDCFFDLFPGSNAGSVAWQSYTGSLPLFPGLAAHTLRQRHDRASRGQPEPAGVSDPSQADLWAWRDYGEYQ